LLSTIGDAHLNKSNYLAHQKQGASSQDIPFKLFQGSSGAVKAVHFFRVPSSLAVDAMDLTALPHSSFPVQGHILSACGDALRICCLMQIANNRSYEILPCKTW
jgi:hypothetical protein